MSTKNIHVRAVKRADIAALSAMAYRVQRLEGYDGTTMKRFTDALIAAKSRLAQHRIWVATECDDLLGTIALATLDKTTAEVRTFYVDPDHRARGIGTLLWNELVVTALSQGVTRLVAKAEQPYARIYKRLGLDAEIEMPSRSKKGQMAPYLMREI